VLEPLFPVLIVLMLAVVWPAVLTLTFLPMAYRQYRRLALPRSADLRH
jgi:hypothetical protein